MFSKIEVPLSGGGMRKVWVNFGQVFSVSAQYTPQGTLHAIRVILSGGGELQFGQADGADDLLSAFVQHLAGG